MSISSTWGRFTDGRPSSPGPSKIRATRNRGGPGARSGMGAPGGGPGGGGAWASLRRSHSGTLSSVRGNIRMSSG